LNTRLRMQVKATRTSSLTPAPGVLQRKCACGGNFGPTGECEACRKKREVATLQRTARHTAAVNAVPPIVHQVLRSPGQPLDAATRAFMQPRFGHDFSQVRVHTDARAAQSAQAVSAVAYTVGRDVVFGAGQFDLNRGSGRRLLAHELSHVVQQSDAASDPDRVVMGDTSSHQEREAESAADTVLDDGMSPFSLTASSQPVLARQAAPVPVRPPMPVRPPLRGIPGGRTGPGGRPLRVPEGERYAPEFDDSLEGMLQRGAEARSREQRIWELERPVATLARGGSPPDFVTDEGHGDEIGKHGQIRYRRRSLHILDAIEYGVGRANSERDLKAIRDRYIPEATEPGWLPPAWEFVITKEVDPGGSRRMQTYVEAVARRSATVSALARGLKLRPETERRRRFPGALPICWATQLGPPMFMGVPVPTFVRTRGVERDFEWAGQQRLQLRYRQSVDPGFQAGYYHVHHSVPLFLGGSEAAAGNMTTVPALLHLPGHQVLRYQPQMANPPVPFRPHPVDLYEHPAGTRYELVGYKERAFETC
jgi:hypothetical protein